MLIELEIQNDTKMESRMHRTSIKNDHWNNFGVKVGFGGFKDLIWDHLGSILAILEENSRKSSVLKQSRCVWRVFKR